MKALEIINLLLTNVYDLEQMGTYNYQDDLRDFFGEGTITNQNKEFEIGAECLYMYSNDEVEFLNGKKPDAVYMAEDGSTILLYSIEIW